MRKFIVIFVILSVSLAVNSIFTAQATCTPSDTGTAGPDVIICTGVTTIVDGLGGNDIITNHGDVAIIFGGGGNDAITNNGDVAVIFGDDGNDAIINNDEAIIILGDDGNDAIINNGETIIIDGGGGNDAITHNGETFIIFGDSGSDVIIVNGGVEFDVLGDDGNDEVILQTNANVQGRLDGGNNNDTLNFAQEIDEVEFVRIAPLFEDLDPNKDTLTVNGREFNWIDFERLINEFSFRTCASHDGRMNDSSNRDCAAPVAIFPGSIVVYGVDPVSGNGSHVLTLSDEQISSIGVPQVNTLLAEGVNPYTGQPIAVYRLTTGEYQLNTSYHDGKPYIVAWDDAGNFYHVAA